MRKSRIWITPFLAAALLLLPGAVLAQEEQPEEIPEPGFRVLGPRTVVSFVRQTLYTTAESAAAVNGAGWNTLLHVTNTGNAPMAAAAIFVSEAGLEMRAVRHFGIAPGKTLTFSVGQIIGADMTNLVPAGDDAALVQGIVLLRFFAPREAPAGSFWSQMITAEQILHGDASQPLLINYLDVEKPQDLGSVRRLSRR